MTETPAPFLSIRGVTKRFGAHQALEAVDLDIARGEFVTLLGPSGCGKTTLLRMIAGFEQPDTGGITLDGADLTRLPPERRPLNMVFQSYALFPHMNVYDNVAYGLRIGGMNAAEVRDQVSRALELVGLDAVADRRVQQLSGGMSQRVALVRALVNEPAVLLLDEPLGALDLQLRKRMQVELRAIQQRVGSTFLYVTHDQEEALVMSHRVVVMNEGRIEQVGAPAEVYHRPRTRFVARFVGEATLLPARVEHAGDAGSVQVVTDAGVELRVPDLDGGQTTPGTRGHVVLRPEHVALAEPAAAPLRGVVEDVIFLGAATHALVRLPDGSPLRATCRDDAPPSPGDAVGISILAGRGVFVHDVEGGARPDAELAPAALAPTAPGTSAAS